MQLAVARSHIHVPGGDGGNVAYTDWSLFVLRLILITPTNGSITYSFPSGPNAMHDAPLMPANGLVIVIG